MIRGCTAAVLAAMLLSGGCRRQEPPRLEMTQQDLFSVQGWDSTQVSLSGVYLGMPHARVGSELAKSGWELEKHPDEFGNWYIDYSDAGQTDWAGVSIKFGADDKVAEITVMGSGPQDSPDFGVYPLPVFKGQTVSLLSQYSETLSKQLLGDPDAVKDIADGSGREMYYNHRGLIVDVDVAPGGGVADLSGLSLVPPGTAVAAQ